MPGETALYQLPHLVGNDGGRHIKEVSLALARRLEAILANTGQVPLDSDLRSLLTRLDALENGVPFQRLAPADRWSANSGAGVPEVSKSARVALYWGGLFGGPANTTATVLPDWATPSRTIQVPIVLGDANATVGSVRIWTDGSFQPSGSLGPRSCAVWPL